MTQAFRPDDATGCATRPPGRAAPGLTALALLILASQAHAQPALRVTDYGEFTVSRELGIRDPGTVEGDTEPVRTVDGVRLVQRTSRIEARLCRRFGIRFVLEGMGPGGLLDVTVQTRHPAITRPGGQVSTGARYPSSVSAERPGWVGFTFDHAYELAPGTWSFAILSGAGVLAEQQFEVIVPPDADQPPPGGCGAPVS